MKQTRILSLLFLTVTLFFGSDRAYGWGKKGHDVICYIAECNLSKRAADRVDDLLDGRSMVYYSSWLDGASNQPEYKYSKTWHYMNMDRDECVATAKREKRGDALSALIELEAILRDRNASFEEQSTALKMYIHIMGDLHQPMHLGRLEDLGGNKIPVIHFVESTSLHSAWDYHIVMGAHEWSYTEWQQQIDRAKESEKREILAGSYEDWANETHELANQVYRDTPAQTRIYYDYMQKYTPVVEQQFLRAGLRLAYILNDIYATK